MPRRGGTILGVNVPDKIYANVKRINEILIDPLFKKAMLETKGYTKNYEEMGEKIAQMLGIPAKKSEDIILKEYKPERQGQTSTPPTTNP